MTNHPIRTVLIIGLSALLIGAGCGPPKTGQLNPTSPTPNKNLRSEIPAPNQTTDMKLTSPAFSHSQLIPAKYTCDGADVNPPMTISDIPSGTQSLVLIVDDPDAPAGDWVHWTLWSIAPNTASITENSVPARATQGLTDFGRVGYGGPCPPSGTHRYQFKLYALDTTLLFDQSARKKNIEKAMTGHILEQTMLLGLYQRN